MQSRLDLADKLLRKHPKHLNFLAPAITWLMTVMAGTGHTAFSTMPVIIEVAKENNIKPSRPLSLAVVASQIAITASPISAAVVFMAKLMEGTDSATLEAYPAFAGTGVDYVQILLVAIPATFLASMLTPAVMMGIDRLRSRSSRTGDVSLLTSDPEYQRRHAEGLVKITGRENRVIKPRAKTSVLIFVIGLLVVMTYAILISDTVGLLVTETNEAGAVVSTTLWGHEAPTRDAAILVIMLATAAVIAMVAKIEPNEVLKSSTFRSGMSASICVLGVAWLGTTFVKAYTDEIKAFAGETLQNNGWLLAVVLVFISALLYSQAAATKAMMPMAVAGLGVAPLAAVAAFPAVSALFILPTYPTLLAAVEMDDTGTTRIGKFVFNHPFLVPGLVNIGIAVALSYLIGAFVI